MKVTTCKLEGILLIEPSVYHDVRGFFLETFRSSGYREASVSEQFVQDNHSRSAKHVLRGLHFTKKRPQAQLLTVIRGRIFDVVVDVRRASPTFGKWHGAELSDEGLRQIYMPHGFAHGFCVLSDYADLHYKVTQEFDAGDDGGLRWNDPRVGIEWPINEPIISARDRNHPFLSELE